MINSISSLWQKIFRPSAKDGVALQGLSLAKGPIYAIGDLHGRFDLLEGIEAQIAQSAARFEGRPQIVLLGDMIDRGSQTAALLDHLLAPPQWADFHAIRGNHEEMMLAFWQDPHANADWLHHGGFETLRSYGLALDPLELSSMSKRKIQQSLSAYVPDTHYEWIAALPYGFSLQRGNETWVLAHASHDPKRELQNQPKSELTWGRNFAANKEKSPFRMVYGHFIQSKIEIDTNWIGIDSGAWTSGILSAIELNANDPARLIQYRAS